MFGFGDNVPVLYPICIQYGKYLLHYFQCYVLWHIYPFSTLVGRACAAEVTLLAKKIPLSWLKKKLMSWWILKVVEIKILAILSRVAGPVELNEMLQCEVSSL